MSEADVESELDSYQEVERSYSSGSVTPTNRHSTPIKPNYQQERQLGSPQYTSPDDDDEYTDRYTWTPETELSQWSTPRKALPYSRRTSGQISRESGRRTPTELAESTTVEIGTQPLTLPRFNEPLKQLRKRRQFKFVDYESPVPTVVYVPHRSRLHGSRPHVSVQRNPDGRYVVIEQRPIATTFTGVDLTTRADDTNLEVFGARVGWTKKKPPWNRSMKSNYLERQINRRFFEPFMPPVKSKYEHVGAKVASMENLTKQPDRPVRKIPTFKLKWEAESKVGSLPSTERDAFAAGNSSKQSKLKLPQISPRFGGSADSASFSSIHYTPGGNVIVKKGNFDVKSRVGSLDNVGYHSPESVIKIPSSKHSWSGNSKVGSMENLMHMPKKSNIQVFHEKLDWQSGAKVRTKGNVNQRPRRRGFRVPHFSQTWGKHATASVNTLENIGHKPKGGNVQMISEKLNWEAKPKIQTRWQRNYEYQSLFDGSDTNSITFTDTASYPYTM